MRLFNFASFAGTEIGNVVRTNAYLRNGLAGSAWTAGICGGGREGVPFDGSGYVADYHSYYDTSGDAGDGYDDVYDDVYGAPGGVVGAYPPTPAGPSCYCEAVDDGPYVSPAADDAPWYDPNITASGEFLGYIPDVVLRSSLVRNATPRAGGGASLGPPYARGRGVEFSGVLISATARGMHYGESWLRRILMGGLPPTEYIGASRACGEDVLTVLPACSDARDFDADPPYGVLSVFRDLHECGLTDPPEFSPPIERANAYLQQVAFQMTAGSPWLRQDIAVTTLNLATSGEQIVQITGSQLADAAAIIEVSSGAAPLDGLVISAQTSTCADIFGIPMMSVTWIDQPALSTLTIDAARRTASLTDLVGNPVTGASAFTVMDFSGLFGWPAIPRTQTMCIRIDPTGATGLAGASVRVTKAHLEA